MDEDLRELLTAILAEIRRIGSILEGFENKKTPTPQMTIDAKQSKDEEKPSPDRTTSSEAVTFCTMHDWLFVKAANGGYSYTIANKAAADFLSVASPADRQRFSDLVSKHRSSLSGRVRVTPGVFENLYAEISLWE